MPTCGGCHPAYQAYTQKPDCRRFKSCPPDQIGTVQRQICGFVKVFLVRFSGSLRARAFKRRGEAENLYIDLRRLG